jgi:iron-sulfur cluster repair protein YtfE (RIC family)
MQKLLERKYKTIVASFGKARNEEELAGHWRDAVASGEVAGAYWALMSHPSASTRLTEQVYGEVHMMSHLCGASQRADLHQLDSLRHRVTLLEARLAEARETTREVARLRDKVIGVLHDRLRQALHSERELVPLRTRIAELESGCELARLSERARALQTALEETRDREQHAQSLAQQCSALARQRETDHLALEAEVLAARRAQEALEKVVHELLSEPACGSKTEGYSGADPGVDLSGRNVLYVGGLPRLCPYFRALTERYNGRFLHHDGGLEDGRARLSDVLRQADAVLCSVSCVSHDACHRLKRLCRRRSTPVVFLRSASLSTFAVGLQEIAS